MMAELTPSRGKFGRPKGHMSWFISILREKSLAIIYNGVSHSRSLTHYILLICRFQNMSFV